MKNKKLSFFKRLKQDYIKGDFFKNAFRLLKKIRRYSKLYGFATTLFIIKNKMYADKVVFKKFVDNTEKNNYSTQKFEYTPIISFVIPVYNVIDSQLEDCINSILSQTYDNYEIVLADDKSTWDSVRNVLEKFKDNPKVNIIYRNENGHISKCTNTAIQNATGEFIAFMDCDDMIAPNTVFEITKILNENKNLDFIYTDDNKITDDGIRRHFPHFKPDWSPDTMMSCFYTNHLGIYRKSIADEIGGLRVGYEGAQDYDFTLRFIEKTNRIGHIPKILYHWRERPESIAASMDSKPYILEIVKKLKMEAFQRNGLKATLDFIPDMCQFTVNYEVLGNPLVSIVISVIDEHQSLERCIKSIVDKTDYKNYEIIVSGFVPQYEKIKKIFESTKIKFINKNMINYSQAYNVGAENSNGEYIVFLKSTTEVISGNWLSRLVGHTSLYHVGAVGAKILYPNTKITKDCGITNLKNGPTSAFFGYNTVNYSERDRVNYNYIAVSYTCMCVKKSKFDDVCGFNENYYTICSPTDFCFKLLEKGFYNVGRVDALLYDYDNVNSEKSENYIKECEMLFKNYPYLKGKDPFYSINFADNKTDFSFNTDGFPKLNNFVESKKNIEKLINKNVAFCVDDVKRTGCHIEIFGWAFFRKRLFNNFNRKFIMLVDDENNCIVYDTDDMLRTDVTGSFGKKKSLNLSGFICNVDILDFSKGNYRIGILLVNKITKRKGAVISDIYINVD